MVEVKCFLDDLELEDEPIGLTQVALSIIRDQETHGIGFEATTSTLEFISNGMEYLIAVKDSLGLKAETIFRVDMRCAEGDDFVTAILGKVNYSNFKDKCGSICSVTVPIESISCEMLLKNRNDQAVDLDANVSFDKLTALDDYDFLGVNLILPTRELPYKTEGNVLAAEPPFIIGPTVTGTQVWIARPDYENVIANNISKSELTGAELVAFLNSSIISPNILWDERIGNFPLPVNVTGRLKGRVSIGSGTLTASEGFLVVVRGEMTPDNWDFGQDGSPDPKYTPISIVTLWNFGESSTGINFDLPYSYAWNPLDSGADGIYAFLTVSGAIGATYTIQWDPETFFKAETVKAVPASSCPAYLIHESLSRVVESISNNCCRVKSSYYGRTDSQPFSFAQDGCGGNRFITSGLKMRNATNGKIFANLRDLFQGLQAIDNIGMGMEEDETRPGRYVLRVEDLDFFYRDAEIFRCLAIPKAQGQLDASKFYSLIKIGYKKWETAANFGLDEFNANRIFRTNLTAIQNTFDRTCIFIGGEYAIEITREQQFVDTNAADTKYDSDNFIVCLERSGIYGYPYGGLEVEQGNVVSDSGIFSPGSVYNYRISPIRNLLRQARSIFASYPNITDSDNRLFFTEGTGNLLATGKLEDAITNPCSLEAVPLKESQDILVTVFKDQDKATPLWRNENVVFDYPMSLADYQKIKANPYGYITYQCGNGELKKGWLTELKYKPFQGIANITIRKTWL